MPRKVTLAPASATRNYRSEVKASLEYVIPAVENFVPANVNLCIRMCNMQKINQVKQGRAITVSFRYLLGKFLELN